MSKEQSKTINILVQLLQEVIGVSDSLAEQVGQLEAHIGEYEQLLGFRIEREAKLGRENDHLANENEDLVSENSKLEQDVASLELALSETAEALQEEWDRARKLQSGDKPIFNHGQTIPFDITTPPAKRKYFFSDTHEKYLAWAEGIYNGEGL